MLIHATTIAFADRAVLITGASGIGKSDLALRLITEHDAMLVSDDQTELIVTEGNLTASPPPELVGRIEVRHIGILPIMYVSNIPVALCVELVGEHRMLERLPDEKGQEAQITFLTILFLFCAYRVMPHQRRPKSVLLSHINASASFIL